VSERADPLSYDDYVAASTLFGRQLVALADDWWFRPTGCGDWDVQALVAHVVMGEAAVVDVVAGARPSPGAEVDVSVLGPNPVATWRGTAVAALRATADAAAAPTVGEVDVATLVGFRTIENLVHAWDLARAGDGEPDVPDDLATRCLDFCLPRLEALGSGGFFADPVMPPQGASAGVRLLSLLGRVG